MEGTMSVAVIEQTILLCDLSILPLLEMNTALVGGFRRAMVREPFEGVYKWAYRGRHTTSWFVKLPM
jgi:hypothetical protein